MNAVTINMSNKTFFFFFKPHRPQGKKVFSGLHMAPMVRRIKRWFSLRLCLATCLALKFPALGSYLSKMRFRADWCAFRNKSMFDEPWAERRKRGYSPWESLMPSLSTHSNEDWSVKVQISVRKSRHPSTVNITPKEEPDDSGGQRDEGEGIHRSLPLQNPLCNFTKVACGWYWWTDEGWHAQGTLAVHLRTFYHIFNFNCSCHDSCC